MKCVIVDDEPLAVKLIETYVARVGGLEVVGAFTDAVAALEVIRSERPHLVFLDVQMPDLSGLKLAEAVLPPTRVIFTTAFKNYAYDSYGVNALDFLLKPIRFSKFSESVGKARSWFERTTSESVTDSLLLRCDGELRRVAVSDVVYVEAMKDYVRFVLADGRKPLVVYMRMNAVADMLPHPSFVRVSRSYIVAVSRIDCLDRNGCVHVGDLVVHVTEAYRHAVSEALGGTSDAANAISSKP